MRVTWLTQYEGNPIIRYSGQVVLLVQSNEESAGTPPTTPSPCSSPSSPLRYGLSKKDLSLSVTANVSTYTPADLCDAPANSTGWKEPGTINSGVMTGLEPNTRYYYVVGDEVRGPVG